MARFEPRLLDYLTRYVFRVAITNARIGTCQRLWYGRELEFRLGLVALVERHYLEQGG